MDIIFSNYFFENQQLNKRTSFALGKNVKKVFLASMSKKFSPDVEPVFTNVKLSASKCRSIKLINNLNLQFQYFALERLTTY